MAAAYRRKITNRREAEQLVEELSRTGGDMSSFCRARGLDGRSLHCWRLNLARDYEGLRQVPARETVRLVEVNTPARCRAEVDARYRLVLGDITIEVDDRFHDDTLTRLLGVVRSC